VPQRGQKQERPGGKTGFTECLVEHAGPPEVRGGPGSVSRDAGSRAAQVEKAVKGARACPPQHKLIDGDELRRAIELPAQRAGLRVEPELADALIADVEGEPGALPLLFTALLELWQQRDGRRMRLNAYQHSGGVHRAVARLAERAYEQLDLQQRETARRILLRLAGEGEGDAAVRRRVQLSELEGERVEDVLAILADERLVTLGEDEVEVAHEALLREWPRLRGWLDEDAQGRHVHLQLGAAAREWNAGGRDAGELYRGARLAGALDWSRDHQDELNAAEQEFLAASRAAGERSQRRLRAVLAGVATLLVLSLIAGVVALDQRGSARQEAAAADAQRLGARALIEPELDRSLLLARQGVALEDTVETRGNLLAALLQSPAAIGVLRPSGQAIRTVALSPDDRTLAVGDDSGKLIFYDAHTRRRLDTLEQEVPASATPDDIGTSALAYSPDGERLAVARGGAYRNQSLWLFDTRTRDAVARLPIPPGRAVARLRYVADGQTLAAVLAYLTDTTNRSELVAFDARTGRRLRAPIVVGDARLSASFKFADSPVSVSSDGRRLVIEGEEETIVRDAATLEILQRLPTDIGEVSASELSRDDRTFAVGGSDGSLYLLDLRSGELRTASGPRGAPVERIAFSTDGRTFVTGDIEGGIIRWNVRRAEALETLAWHRGTVRAFAVASDGDTLYNGSLDRSVIEWDLAGARRLGRRFRAGPDDNVNNPRHALSFDGHLLAFGQNNGNVSVVDARTLRPLREIPVGARVGGIGFVPRSHRLVVGDADGDLALADADSGRVLWRVHAHDTHDTTIATPGISADARLLVTAAGTPRRALLVAVRRTPARIPARLPGFPSGRPAEPRWPPRRGLALEQAGALGRPHAPSRAQPQGRRGRPHGALLSRWPADRRGERQTARRCCPRPTGRRSRACSPGTPGGSGGPRSAATTARWPPAARTVPCGCGTSIASRPSARRCPAYPAISSPVSSRRTATP
jgi:WD40 repeat protein